MNNKLWKHNNNGNVRIIRDVDAELGRHIVWQRNADDPELKYDKTHMLFGVIGLDSEDKPIERMLVLIPNGRLRICADEDKGFHIKQITRDIKNG